MRFSSSPDGIVCPIEYGKTKMTETSLTKIATSPLVVALLFFGPLASVLLAPLTGWEPTMVFAFQALALLAWSPLLPFGVPALFLQDVRDSVKGPFRPLSVTLKLFFTGPAAVVTTSWLNVAGVGIATVALLAFLV